jgi:lysophospholipase L1-like esterase
MGSLLENSTQKTARPRSRPREWLLRTILVGSSLLVGIGVAEMAARVVRVRQAGGKEGREDAQYKEYDPLLGWRKKKNAKTTYRRREYTVDVDINSEGLRDPERGPDTEPGTFRVLALGDSFVEGYTVEVGQTVTQRLESRIRELGCAPKAEVINGGTSAYSTDQEYLFYRTEGVRYRPSLVLLFFFWNDVIYTDRQDYFGTPKPAFEIGEGRLRVHRYPVRKKPEAPPSPPATESKDEPRGSALLEMLRERLWYGAPAAHDALARLGLWSPIPDSNPRLEMLVYDHRDLAQVEDAWEKVGRVLEALRKDVEDHGSRLAIAYIPGKMEIQESSWDTTRTLYRLKDGAWDLHKVRDKVRHFGAQLGIPVIDLSPALEAAELPFRSTYFTFDGHWNARGHDVASSAVFDWMKKSGSLPSACGGELESQARSAEAWDPQTDAPR